jgi:hypothetical protein
MRRLLDRVRDVDLAAYLDVPIGELRHALSKIRPAHVGVQACWYRWKDLKSVVTSEGLRLLRGAARRRVSHSSSRYWVDGYPLLVAQWHPRNRLLPYQVSHGSERKIWWRCEGGPDHEWRARVYSRTRGAGCPFCTTRRVSVTNSLATCRPDIAAQWHSTRNGRLTPDRVVRSSHVRAWWQCPKDPDHQWEATVHGRTTVIARGCPFCVGQRVSRANSLSSRCPSVACEWAAALNGGLSSDEVTAGTRRAFWWQCAVAADHVWKATINNRVANGSGCPFCAQRRATRAESLAGVSPLAAALWHPTKNGKRRKPEEVNAKSERYAWWICQKGHVWSKTIRDVVQSPVCPACRDA